MSIPVAFSFSAKMENSFSQSLLHLQLYCNSAQSQNPSCHETSGSQHSGHVHKCYISLRICQRVWTQKSSGWHNGCPLAHSFLLKSDWISDSISCRLMPDYLSDSISHRHLVCFFLSVSITDLFNWCFPPQKLHRHRLVQTPAQTPEVTCPSTCVKSPVHQPAWSHSSINLPAVTCPSTACNHLQQHAGRNIGDIPGATSAVLVTTQGQSIQDSGIRMYK